MEGTIPSQAPNQWLYVTLGLLEINHHTYVSDGKCVSQCWRPDSDIAHTPAGSEPGCEPRTPMSSGVGLSFLFGEDKG